MLCDRCQKRDATAFSTQIIFGQTTETNLCEECATQSAFGLLPGVPQPPSWDGARCFYCGATPLSLSLNDAYAFASRQQHWHFCCDRCCQMSNSLLLKTLSNLPKGLPRQEERLLFEQLYRDVDAHLRASLGDAK